MNFSHQLGKRDGKINWIGRSEQFGPFWATLTRHSIVYTQFGLLGYGLKGFFLPSTGFDEKIRVSSTGFRRRKGCLLYTSPSPRDQRGSRMPSSA